MPSLDEYLQRVNTGFCRRERDGVVFYTIPSFDELGFVKHGFTSRIGGVSSGEYESLNLSLTRENNRENVRENYRRAARAIGVDPDALVICHYEHGTNVEYVNASHIGMGLQRENELPFCDGIIVTDPDTVAVTIHADCNPIFFADKKGRAAGACHAGWRGVYGNILATIVEKLGQKGISPKDILLGFGPSIGVCCFEVQEDVGGLFARKFGEDVREFREGKQFVDLWRVLAEESIMLGIPAENVTFSKMCTYCSRELFYSHRRDRGKTGAMGSFVQLLDARDK